MKHRTEGRETKERENRGRGRDERQIVGQLSLSTWLGTHTRAGPSSAATPLEARVVSEPKSRKARKHTLNHHWQNLDHPKRWLPWDEDTVQVREVQYKVRVRVGRRVHRFRPAAVYTSRQLYRVVEGGLDFFRIQGVYNVRTVLVRMLRSILEVF